MIQLYYNMSFELSNISLQNITYYHILGTALLSTDGGPLTIGDAWCVAAAVTSALFILRLEKFSQENNAAELSGVSFATVTALCGVWVGCDFYQYQATELINQASSVSYLLQQFNEVSTHVNNRIYSIQFKCD